MQDTPQNRVRIAARLEEMSLLGCDHQSDPPGRDVAEFKVDRRPATARWPMSDIEREFYDNASREIANLRDQQQHQPNASCLRRPSASSRLACQPHTGTGVLRTRKPQPRRRG